MSTRSEIVKLLRDGRFHSGTDMGRALGISRAAVCKGIKALSDLGLEIHKVSGRGYRLATSLQPLDKKHILGHLSDKGVDLHGRLDILESVDSTSRYLLEKINASPTKDAICLAEAQLQGRGRRGRSWAATPYSNLMLSMAWRLQSGPAVVSGLSLAAGVAVARALDEYGVRETTLKWPNDVLWKHRKLAGLLVDVAGEAAGPCFVVLGVGVNGYISERDAEYIDQPWVDLQSIIGDTVDRNYLAAILIAHLTRMFETFSTNGLAAFREEWERRHLYNGKRVRLIQGDTEFQGEVEGIDETGALCIRDETGVKRVFHSGEISMRLAE